jgi:hypothetical protein
MATVIIPTPLRKFTNQTAKVQIEAGTIGEVIDRITLDFPELKNICSISREAYVHL